MARTNKYASLNFNDIYDKKKKTINNNNQSPNPSSTSNNTSKTNSRIHGNMLVLTRPTPKPISSLLPASQTQTPSPVNPDPTQPSSDSISLRPLGTTGGGSTIATSVSRLPKDLCFVSSDKFVPPHLRPGYVCKEEKLQPVSRQQPKSGEESRPTSGGGGGGVGYERMRRGGGGGGPDFVFRPGSSGSNNRPNSTG